MDKMIRFQQRFNNLANAFTFLAESMELSSYSPLEEAGVIQSFEFTFELSWKTLKDYLEAHGTLALYPRDVIKEAFASGLILDGHMWLDMLDRRNLLSHTYDRKRAEYAVKIIKEKYFPCLKQVFMELQRKCMD
jgi:nucleotidyltransferase substrate binding protein (TIGR01987 family)